MREQTAGRRPTQPNPMAEPTHPDLLAAIQEQIIPRLLLAHQHHLDPLRFEDQRPAPTPEEVAQLAALAVAHDCRAVEARVLSAIEQGLSVPTTLVHLVCAAATRLGDQWLDDEISFADVTLGLGVFTRVVYSVGRDIRPVLAPRGKAVLGCLPGEQHTFAIQVLGEVFRCYGLAVQVEPEIDQNALCDLAYREEIAIIGVSVSNEELFGAIEPLISDVKAASRNPDMVVLLGGAPELEDVAPAAGAVYCASADEAIGLLRLAIHDVTPTSRLPRSSVSLQS